MPSTFISLTNQLLRKFNEVEVSEGDFLSARGVQGRAKDAIKDSIDRINQIAWNWPFNSVNYTMVLEPGTSTYVPQVSNLARIDWESFQIVKDDTLNINNRNLGFIDEQDWFQRHRDTDNNSGITGRGLPHSVFPRPNGFGLTPVPNEPYSITFRYWSKANELQFAQDLVHIPSEFDYVIISSAAVAMHEFRDNAEAAALMRAQFKDDFGTMRNLLLNNYDVLRDTRVPRHSRTRGWF